MKRGAEPDFLRFGQQGPPTLVAKGLEMTGCQYGQDQKMHREIWLNFMVQKTPQKNMKQVLMSIVSDMVKMTTTLWAR